MSKKDLRARVDPDDYSTGQRLLDRLGMSMQDALEGWWYRLIHGDEDAEAAASDYHRAKADVEALKRREERLEERIEQLEEEREAIREERREAEERLEEAQEGLVDVATAAHADGDGGADDPNSIEQVAYELLVDVAHDRIGSNGLTAGEPEIHEQAARAGVDPDELIEEMRRLARPAGEALEFYDDIVENGMLKEDEVRVKKHDRPSSANFDRLREMIAKEVLDEDEVDWDEVPTSKYG